MPMINFVQGIVAAKIYSNQDTEYVYDPCGLAAYGDAVKVLQSLGRIEEYLEQNRMLYEGITSSDIQKRVRIKSKEANNAIRLIEKYNYWCIYDDGTANLRLALHSQFFHYVSPKNEINSWLYPSIYGL